MNALKDTTNNIITRRIHAVIRGSLAQFANSGSESASWTSANGRMSDILGVTDLLQGTADAASTTALLQNSLLHNVRILEYKNDFPIALGVSISCVPSREMTRTGTGYAFSCLPNNVNSNALELYANEACWVSSFFCNSSNCCFWVSACFCNTSTCSFFCCTLSFNCDKTTLNSS